MKARKNILLAFALTIPLIIFFAGYYFNHSKELEPTGFVQYDNVSYIAYAKQYLDQGAFHLQYSNPFNDNNNYQSIYFQPQTLFFALLLKIGIPAKFILPLFTIISAFVCFLFLIAIYDRLALENKNRTINLWLFGWGGGLLVLAGIIYHYLHNSTTPLSNDFFTIDPEGGNWGLSFGRALFFSCEAYYHALFLATIYCLLNQKWVTALVTSFILSISHPFTGIELALIVLCWFAFEFLYNRKNIPIWFGLGALGIVVFHAWYYLMYLPGFPDHESVSRQYSLTWGLRYYRMIPAYCIVGSLAVISIYKASVRNFFADSSNRLLLCWFLTAFLLANHDLFLSPKQPIHFTRGYIWTSLFLLGLPALQWLVSSFRKRSWALFLFSTIFLFDNFLWITIKTNQKATHSYINYITAEQKTVLENLDRESSNQTLIISSDENLSYLSSVYTKAYPLYSHPFTTPFASSKHALQQKFLKQGILDSSLQKRQINFVLQKQDSIAIESLKSLSAKKVFETGNYSVFCYNAR